jgi:tetratricopeptide (TPR) repeat protein
MKSIYRITILLICFASFTAGVAAQNGVKTAREAASRVRSMYFALDHEGAVETGKKLAAQFPESTELKAWLVMSMLAMNMATEDVEKEAIEMAEKMVAKDASDGWAQFAMAAAVTANDAIAEKERGEKAIAASEKAFAAMPGNADAIWLKAEMLRRHGKRQEAVDFVDASRAKVKSAGELMVVRAAALFSLAKEAAKKEEAYKAFAEARAVDTSNVNAHYLPGIYLRYNKRVDEAYPLLKRAAMLAPDSVTVHKEYWQSVMVSKEMSLEKKKTEIESDIARLMKYRAQETSAIYEVSRQYGALKMKEKQKELEEQVLRQAPASPQAQWILVHRYRAFREQTGQEGIKDPKQKGEYAKMLRDFIKYPHHPNKILLGDTYRALFFLVGDDAETSDGELLDIVNGMVKYDRWNPHISYGEGALALAKRKVHFRHAEKLARDGIEATLKRVEEQRRFYETESSYEKARSRAAAQMQDALGWVFFNEGRLDDAEKELLQAHAANAESVQNIYHAGQVYEAKKAFDKAEEFYIKGISIQHPGENPNAKALKDLYLARNGKLDGYEAYMAGIREKESIARKQRVVAERIAEPQPMGAFKLKTLDGAELSSGSLMGRITVINYWGVWCGWCVKEMPEFQKLHERYKNDPDVLILTINNDDNLDTARNYMKENKYDFKVLIDDGYVTKMGVQSFPTTWFIDQSGRKAYIKEGWTEKLSEEFSWRIEALRTPDAARR